MEFKENEFTADIVNVIAKHFTKSDMQEILDITSRVKDAVFYSDESNS
ncbi:MAG: hypothetical protein ACLGH8_02070 [Bacteroidia bacterium]